MQIQLAEHMGFCYGVKRAVELALAGGGNTLGPLIHNPQMVEWLTSQGVVAVSSLADVTAERLVIRSHGEGPDVYEAITNKGLQLADATCPHVRKAQQAAAKFTATGRQVLILGERGHPEVKSILAWAGSTAIVVETLTEIQQLPAMEKVGVVVQTTFATTLLNELLDAIKLICIDVVIEPTICTATEQRQQAARQLATQCEVVVVIGGRNSGNTSRLVQVCRETGARVYHIETAVELCADWFEGVNRAGITAGASTPDWIIEEVYQTMQDFNQEQGTLTDLTVGTIIKGKVVQVQTDQVRIDIGHKTEGVIERSELAYPAPETAAEVVSEGQEIAAYIVAVDENQDQIVLSKLQADRLLGWEQLQTAFNEQQPITAQVTAVIKGGLTTSAFGIRAFVPASQVDLARVEDLAVFVGQSLEFIPIEIEPDKNRVVLSRRILLQAERQQREAERFASLKVGQQVTGVVRRVVDFGAFVDIGGIDALLHISDMSWQRISNPTEVVAVGDSITATITKLDEATHKIGLSLKTAESDPWYLATQQLKVGDILDGKVSKHAKFGAFIEILPGIEGLAHISELADHRVASADEVVKVGQSVRVKILGVDREQKRISLSVAQAQQAADHAEFSSYMRQQTGLGVTLGDKLGDKLSQLFKQ